MTIQEALELKILIPIEGTGYEDLPEYCKPEYCEWFIWCRRTPEYCRRHPSFGFIPVCETHALTRLDAD